MSARHIEEPVSSSAADIARVREFWEANPLCASAIPYPLGSPDYFKHYDSLREANESIEFSSALHEYQAFCGKRVLDVGCGNGYVLSRYARAGAHVQGIDLTRTAVELSRRRFDLLGLDGGFAVANAEDLPFASASFDCVCSMGVLHHTPDTARAIAEIWRVLRPGGRLIVMFYHRHSVLNQLTFRWMRLRTGKTRQQIVNEVDGYGNPKGDVFSRRELARLLHRFTASTYFVDLLQPWMLPARVQRLVPRRCLAWAGRRWGWFLYAKATKPLAGER